MRVNQTNQSEQAQNSQFFPNSNGSFNPNLVSAQLASLTNQASVMREEPQPSFSDVSKPNPSVGLRADADRLFSQADVLDAQAKEIRQQFTGDLDKDYSVNGKIIIYPGKEGEVDPGLLARAKQQEAEEKEKEANNPAKGAIARAEALEAEAQELRVEAKARLEEAAKLDKETQKEDEPEEPKPQDPSIYTR